MPPLDTLTPIIIAVVIVFMFGSLFLNRKRGRPRQSYQTRIRWFSPPQNRPAIYIIQSVHDPRAIKVGYTGRKVEARMTEIAGVHGPVRLLFSLRMPHAYTAEQAAHKRLRSAWWVENIGGEWYRGDPARIRRHVMRAARSTRRTSKLKLSWPGKTKIFTWKDF